MGGDGWKEIETPAGGPQHERLRDATLPTGRPRHPGPPHPWQAGHTPPTPSPPTLPVQPLGFPIMTHRAVTATVVTLSRKLRIVCTGSMDRERQSHTLTAWSYPPLTSTSPLGLYTSCRQGGQRRATDQRSTEK